MREVTRKLYYCDFCRKRHFHKPGCQKHERVCTMNPERYCGWCKRDWADGGRGEPLTVSGRYAPDGAGPFGKDFNQQAQHDFAALVKFYNGCPMCLLAELRLAGVTSYDAGWDLAAAKAAWNAELRAVADAYCRGELGIHGGRF